MKNRDELEALGKPELIEFGQNLNPPALMDMSAKKGDMVELLLRAQGVTITETPKETAPVETKARDLPPISRFTTLDGKPVIGRMYDLMIHATEADRGDVSVTVNGYHFKMQRGVTVRVPEAVVNVLKDSVITTVRYNPSSRRNEPATIQTYPFQATAV
jgi:hypothetical protein